MKHEVLDNETIDLEDYIRKIEPVIKDIEQLSLDLIHVCASTEGANVLRREATEMTESFNEFKKQKRGNDKNGKETTNNQES